MRLNIAIMGLLMVLVSGAVHAETIRKASEPTQETGRFVIYTVEYESSGGVRGLYNRKVVIKMDTVTGKTWFLKDMPNKGIESSGTTKYWVEIEDYAANKYPVYEQAK